LERCEGNEVSDYRQLAVIQMRPAPAEATAIGVVAQEAYEVVVKIHSSSLVRSRTS
jgi:hypothetical protein